MGPIGKLNPIWFRSCNENCQYLGDVFWSILVPFLVHFEVILVHFWVMLGLWGPFWGPLTPLGAFWDPHQNLNPFLSKSGKMGQTILGPFLDYVVCVLVSFWSTFVGSDVLINFGKAFGGVNVAKV